MKNKVLKILAVLSCLIVIGAVLYTHPSKWIAISEKNIASLNIKSLSDGKSVTVSEADEIDNIVKIIKHTRTKKRILFPKEIDFMGPDSGYIITAYDAKNESVSLRYDSYKGGLICGSTNTQSISFRNDKLENLFIDYLQSAS